MPSTRRPRENVELIREVYATYDSGGDVTQFLDPGIVWNPVEEEPSTGIEAVLSYIDRWTGEWDDYEQDVESLLDAGDSVVATIHFRGRGKASGIEADARLYEVWTVRQGRVVRMDEYGERAEALEAVGLPE